MNFYTLAGNAIQVKVAARVTVFAVRIVAGMTTKNRK
jgi:hypothetical protein